MHARLDTKTTDIFAKMEVGKVHGKAQPKTRFDEYGPFQGFILTGPRISLSR